MLCDWIFISKNGVEKVTTNEITLPLCGDGKSHNKVGYKVEVVAKDLIHNPNPIIIAIEHN